MYTNILLFCIVFFSVNFSISSSDPLDDIFIPNLLRLIDSRAVPFIHNLHFNFSRECVQFFSSFTYFTPKCSLPSSCGNSIVEKVSDVSFFTSLYICHGFFKTEKEGENIFMLRSLIVGTDLYENKFNFYNRYGVLDDNFVFFVDEIGLNYGIMPRHCVLDYYVLPIDYVRDFSSFSLVNIVKPFKIIVSSDNHIIITVRTLVDKSSCALNLYPLYEYKKILRTYFINLKNVYFNTAPVVYDGGWFIYPYSFGLKNYRYFNALLNPYESSKVRMDSLHVCQFNDTFIVLCSNFRLSYYETNHTLLFHIHYLSISEGIIDYFLFAFVQLIKKFFTILIPFFNYLFSNIYVYLKNIFLIYYSYLFSHNYIVYLVLFILYIFLLLFLRHFIISIVIFFFFICSLYKYLDLN